MSRVTYALCCIILFFSMPAFSQDITPTENKKEEQENTATQSDSDRKINEMEQQLQDLENELKTLEQPQTESNLSKEELQYVIKDVQELKERIDDVERSTLVDRLKFSVDFRSTVNNYLYRDKTKAYMDYSEKLLRENSGLLSEDGETLFVTNMRMRLKMRAHLGKKFKFTGWLTMYKGFNTAGVGQYEDTRDIQWGYYPDGKLWVERAYVDYFATDWLAFTIGRSPTTDGVPMNIRNRTVRLGTFNETIFNTPFDCLFTTFKLHKLGIPESFLRFMLVHISMIDNTGTKNLIKSDLVEDSWYMAMLYEQAIPKITGSKISINLIFMPKMHLPFKDVTNKDILENKGSLSRTVLWNALISFENIMQTGLTLFASYNGMYVTPPNRMEKDDGVVFIGGNPTLAFYGRTDGKLRTGHMIYAGFQYALPFEMYGDQVRIGADYNHATRDFFNQYLPDTTGMDRFATRGHYSDIYTIIPLYRKSNIKVGYIRAQHNYEAGIPFGQVSDDPYRLMMRPVDEVIHNIYMMLNIEF